MPPRHLSSRQRAQLLCRTLTAPLPLQLELILGYSRETVGFETGAIIGDYQVIAHLGSGGMGAVYKVRNVISDRVEAMRVVVAGIVVRYRHTRNERSEGR